MKITIYELLGLIKDGKAPKKIKYEDDIYEYCERMYGRFNYKNIETNEYFSDEWFIENILNNIVEIIEEVEDKEEVKNDDDFTGVRGYCNGVEIFSFNYTGDMEAYKKYLKKVKKDIDKIIEDKEYEDIEEITYKPRKVQNAINTLIRNQKKIIERLDK